MKLECQNLLKKRLIILEVTLCCTQEELNALEATFFIRKTIFLFLTQPSFANRDSFSDLTLGERPVSLTDGETR
ncbi:hypothetical protein IRJ41_012666 [Triplophysa rosa]|uniref:Uncharacterized protein n=1 Tax=Triplophysa rosa TaxID=992332 RepID=A0A9W7WH90_TRIRA|nr:hypothetical protein IRJ41_012666 [Triplophysa rosa]